MVAEAIAGFGWGRWVSSGGNIEYLGALISMAK